MRSRPAPAITTPDASASTTLLGAAPSDTRLLLCACPAHCAAVLRAAARARVPLHGLQPVTDGPWPTNARPPQQLLWALLPPASTATTAPQLREQRWRAQWQAAGTHAAVQMLYGTPEQQAQQLAPWLGGRPDSDSLHTALGDGCDTCLDPSSEQQLFQHLLQRTRA